jgi:TRAP-type C4-dicarboxylate transport system substrate-binding protein
MMSKTIRFAMAACAIAVASTAVAQAPKVLRLPHYISGTAVQSKVDQWWAKEIEGRTNGAYKVQFFWSESLAKATEILDLVGSGGVELGSTSPAYYPSRLPYSAITHLPLTISDNKKAQIIQTELMALPQLAAENRKNRVVPLLWHSLPNYSLICNKPIRTMAELRGAKLRSFGEYLPVLWKTVGAVGVNVLPAEIYDGLQRGNIDCAYLSMDIAANLKLYEVAKFIPDINFGAISAWPIYINESLWNSMPEDHRRIFREVSAEAAARDRDEVTKAAADGLEAMKRGGAQVIEFKEKDQFQKAVPNMIDQWYAIMSTRGDPEGVKAVSDFLRTKVK